MQRAIVEGNACDDAGEEVGSPNPKRPGKKTHPKAKAKGKAKAKTEAKAAAKTKGRPKKQMQKKPACKAGKEFEPAMVQGHESETEKDEEEERTHSEQEDHSPQVKKKPSKRGSKRSRPSSPENVPAEKSAPPGKEKATFARRWRPSCEPSGSIWDALKSAFEEVVQPAVSRPSALEDSRTNFNPGRTPLPTRNLPYPLSSLTLNLKQCLAPFCERGFVLGPSAAPFWDSV